MQTYSSRTATAGSPRDLRVSLTDRCNLRCTYCMPEEGLDWLAKDELLTDDEIVRLVTVAVERLGVREVRFTGGEPLVRRGAVDIVSRVNALDPRPETSITTNGLGLARTADALAAAGLDRVNVSLDTVRRETFTALTRRDRLHDVVEGLAAAQRAGLGPVKVNAVLIRGVNDDQAPELLDWCLERDYELRFIEQMPLDAQHGWTRDGMITADEILASLERTHVLSPAVEPRGSSPAELFLVDGGPGTVGVIASVTRPFCGDCDRVRLTADGQVRNCLFARDESDLRTALRAGADDDELARRWVTAMAGKLRRPRHRRRDLPAARPADVGHRRLATTRGRQAQRARACSTGTTSRRKPRAVRKSARLVRCSSHAVQTLRRSGVCSRGLFHSRPQAAGAVQPRAEHVGVSVPGGVMVTCWAGGDVEVVPADHGGSRPAPPRGRGTWHA